MPGARLPSIRQLARQLGVSPSTVAAAYGDLRSRGSIVTRDRSRAYVGWAPPLPAYAAAPALGPGVRDLASGNPDPSLLPDLDRVLRNLRADGQRYGGPAVVPELETLARRKLAEDGVEVNRITLASGALDAVDRALTALFRPGDMVAVEDPGYAALFDLVRAHGLLLAPVAVDDGGPVPAALEDALDSGARGVVITPRGQNPYGCSLSAERADVLRSVLHQHQDVIVIEDDHLGEVAGAPRVSTLGTTVRSLAVRSLGKALAPDLRLAVLAGDADTIGRIEARQRLGPLWVSHLLQLLATRVWDDPATSQLLHRAGDAYAERREALIGALGSRGLSAHGASGFNVWVDVADEVAAVTRLYQAGVAVMPGTAYRLAASPGIRITVSELDPAEAADVAEAIWAAFRPSRRMTRAA